MIKKLIQISVALLIVFTVSASTMQPNIPEFITIDGITRNFCGTFSGNPSDDGSKAYATGYVACINPVAWLRADVQVKRYSNSVCTSLLQSSATASNYCNYTTSYCEDTASLALASGTYYYNSVTSGYWPGDDNLYISDCIQITK